MPLGAMIASWRLRWAVAFQLFPVNEDFMSRRFALHSMTAAAVLAAFAASAQPTPPAPAPAASTPAASAAQAPGYQSSLERYRPFAEEKPIPWSQANDMVRQIGGWRAYARQAQDATPSGDPSPRRDAAPGAAGHGKP